MNNTNIKFFDKTFDEIYDILSEVNDSISESTGLDFPPELTFTFNRWAGWFEFNEIMLFSTEDDPREYIEQTDSFEDLKPALLRKLNEVLDTYSKISLISCYEKED